MKLLLYCTKTKPYLIGRKNNPCEYYLIKSGQIDGRDYIHNGKIVGECDYEVEEIIFEGYGVGLGYKGTKTNQNILANKSCLYSYRDIDGYLKGKNGYAIHIKNLHIFDKPRPTKWYGYTNKKGYRCSVNKAPQNMMYCYDEFGDDYVLISIHSEWLCKILNGEKTVEVRKKVLKEML